MINVSKDALQVCRATVQQLCMQINTKCLRLIEQDEGVALSIELPRNDDQVVHDQGIAVLAVPEKSARALSGMTLDVMDDGTFVLS